MFQGFSNETIDFMWGIRFNNEKGWFEAHKAEYLQYFYEPLKSLSREVYAGRLGSFVFFYVAVKRTVSALLFSTPRIC